MGQCGLKDPTPADYGSSVPCPQRSLTFEAVIKGLKVIQYLTFADLKKPSLYRVG